MFKVISNVGAWDTVFVAATATRAVQAYMPARTDIRGRDRDVIVLELAYQREPRLERPNMILLVSDAREPVAAWTIRTSLIQDAGAQLQRIVGASNLSVVRDEVSRFNAVCNDVAESIAISDEPSARSGAVPRIVVALSILTLLALACAVTVLRDYYRHLEGIRQLGGQGPGSISDLTSRATALNVLLRTDLEALDKCANDIREFERTAGDLKRTLGPTSGPGLSRDVADIGERARDLRAKLEALAQGPDNIVGLGGRAADVSKAVSELEKLVALDRGERSLPARAKAFGDLVDEIERALGDRKPGEIARRIEEVTKKIAELDAAKQSAELALRGKDTLLEFFFEDTNTTQESKVLLTLAPGTKALVLSLERPPRADRSHPSITLEEVQFLDSGEVPYGDATKVEAEKQKDLAGGGSYKIDVPNLPLKTGYRVLTLRVRIGSKTDHRWGSYGPGGRGMLRVQEVLGS